MTQDLPSAAGDGAPPTADNRAVLSAKLKDKTARAMLKRLGDEMDDAVITASVTSMATARIAAIERELRDADADMA